MTLYPSILTQILITVIAVCGIYIFTGLTSMFSLGQTAFMAVNSYALDILVVKCGFPFWLVYILTVLIAVVIGCLIGSPTVHLRRDYISLVTLGFGGAITALLNRTTKLTSSISGFIRVPKKTTFLLTLISTIATITVISWFKTSKCDRQYIAVRGDELATRTMGISVPKIKMSTFLLSVAVTAFNGCLYTFFITYVGPTIFGQRRSADWVIMVFFDGTNSLTGSVVGAFILNGLPEVFRSLDQCRSIICAVLVLFTINSKPSGILRKWELSPRNLKALGEKLAKRSRKEEKTDGAA